MKIILSRKGFDSSIGYCPNPILPDGTLLSLPIPTSVDTLPFDRIRLPSGKTYRQVVEELNFSKKSVQAVNRKAAHLDPDLNAKLLPRKKGWRPSFGQVNAAAGHLRNQNVEKGSLFLFYGWFRQTEDVKGRLQFADAPNIHAIYGYMEVGRKLPAGRSDPLPDWLDYHPHAMKERRGEANNVIFVAPDRLSHDSDLPGAGLFRYRPELVLTAPGMTRGRWRLPEVLREVPITYHEASAWKDGYFQSYPRAQEYVIDPDRRAINWAVNLIRSSPRAS